MLNRRNRDELTLAASQKPEEQAFWLERLSGEVKPTSFPYDMPDTGRKDDYHEFPIQLDNNLAAGLKKMAGDSSVRLHLVLASLAACLAGQYGNTGDVLIGTPIFSGDSTESLINTVLPLRLNLQPHMSFKDLVLSMRDVTVQATQHQNFPMEILAEKLGFSQNQRRFPLFDIVVVLDDNQEIENILWTNPSVVFRFASDDSSLFGKLIYKPYLYHPQSIERFAAHFSRLARQMVAAPQTGLEEADILTDEERHTILNIFNDTATNHPADETIPQLFEKRVAEAADHIAVRFFHLHLTYRELNERSNRLAHFLRTRGVGRDTVVGLLMDRSLELIVSVVAVLKAGGAYLPLDPHFPERRLYSILDENLPPVVITRQEAVKAMSFSSLQSSPTLEVEIVKTPPRQPVTCFDDLPRPNRTLVDYDKYHRRIGIAPVKKTVTLQMSRGCPYNCLYCHKIWPKNHVTRSAEHVMEEIRYCRDAGVRQFVFIDDIFNLDKKNSGKILETIIKEELDIQLFFPNGLRADILDREFIDLMAEAGTVNIDVALESGSERIQKLMRKNLNIEKFVENVRYIATAHPQIILEMEMLQGVPTETEDEALLTLEILKEIKWVHFPNLNILKIFPNTDMYRLAIEQGVSRDAIMRSTNFAYHELPATLPYPASFTRQCQAMLLDEYFLSKERLRAVLPVQMKILSEEELVQKYDTYLPVRIRSFQDILDVCGLAPEDLGDARPVPEGRLIAGDFNEKIKHCFKTQKKEPGALRVLLLDLSQFFSGDSGDMLYDVVEEPLGLMCLLTYLEETFGGKIDGKILKARIDFDGYSDLKRKIEAFNPQLIGIRTLSYFKDFFHHAVTRMRQWGVSVPIIAGGPYATSDYVLMLKDPNVNLAVLGEGELTFAELVGKMLENDGNLPPKEILSSIQGLAFVDQAENSPARPVCRDVVVLDEGDDWLPEDVSNPALVNEAGDLVYLISTSGSTGKPKSVMMEHRSLCNLIGFQYRQSGIDFSRVLQFASISFDVSFQEIFSTLLAGGELYLVDENLRSQVSQLWEMLEKNSVKTMFIPPAFLRFVFEEERLAASFPRSVAHIICAGEQLVVTDPMKWRFKENKVTIHNHYGPSETHVVTTYTAPPEEDIPTFPPIGKPLANVNIYITDQWRRLQPVGIPGEIYIEGTMVGRGYFQRDDLTAERYFDGLFNPGQKVFRTGDLGRWLLDGNIHYLGRTDQQVQVRGFRVELPEIERHLSAVPWVKDAAVIDVASQSGEVSLAAYIVCDGDDTFDPDELRERLAASLPDYMIPAYFIRMKEIPLSNSGKVNRRLLPEPGSDEAQTGFTPPRNNLERRLAGIWAGVLGVAAERVGIDDNFFHLGGHSLKGTILISRIHQEMSVKLQLVDLFASPTIRKMARLLNEAEDNSFKPIPEAIAMDYYPLSPAQKRLYILQRMNPSGTTYNIPAIVWLEGETGKEKMEAVFNKLVRRHEMLRTSFAVKDGTPVQLIHQEATLTIVYREADGDDPGDGEKIARYWQSFIKPFDLAIAPLMRVEMVKFEAARHLLMVDMHHIISDAVSMEILIREFQTLHRGDELLSPEIQYRDFTLWQQEQFQSEDYLRQEEYWLRQFQGEFEALDLPQDFPRPAVKSGRGDTAHRELGPGLLASLETLCRETNTTKYQLLLAVYFVLLSRYSGQRDIIVGSPLSGRRHPQLEQVLGVFVNMAAMRGRLAGGARFLEFLEQVKQTAISAFDHQDYPFERLVTKLELQGEAGRNPVFDVGFLLNAIDIESDSAGALKITPVGTVNKVSRFDLLLAASESPGRLGLNLEFSTDLFRPASAERILDHYLEILQQIIDNPRIPVDDIDISSRLEAAAGLENENEIQFGF